MNNIIERSWKRTSLVNIEDLRGMTFQGEKKAHIFKITGIDASGNKIMLDGTPSGVVLRPDHTDVVLDCEIQDGIVRATLPQACYDVQGRIGISIFLTEGGQTTCLYAAIASVNRTSSGNAAPPAAANVVDLVNAISAAVNTIPQSWTGLMEDIAPTYSNSAVYAEGAYVYYDGDLYRCTTAITSGETWNSAHWTAVAIGNDIISIKKSAESANNVIRTGTEILKAVHPGGREQATIETITANTARCTTDTFRMDMDSLWDITGIPSGCKYVIIGLFDNGETYSSGWLTADSHSRTREPGIYAVNVAKSNGTSSIKPEDVSTFEVRITNPVCYFADKEIASEVIENKKAMEMLITKAPEGPVQVIDLTNVPQSVSSEQYRYTGFIFPIRWFGDYYINPTGQGIALTYAKPYTKDGRRITIYRNGSSYSSGLYTSANGFIRVIDRRNFETYTSAGALSWK